ncbi:MAG: phosphotransferase [Candidatus Latescibacteria bacterium]|nr:phosphotransferase [Candidatus Latescibacterota bacterium]
MQTAPNIAHETIATALRSHYDFALQNLEFWPTGEASYGFIATLDGAPPLFLKILDPTLATHHIAIAHLDRVLPLILALSEAGLPLSRPLQTGNGALHTAVNRFHLVALEYLDGATLGEKPWPAAVYPQLGRAVGRLHALTAELARYIPPRDGTSIPSRQDLETLLADIEAAANSPIKARRKLSAIVTPLRQQALDYHATMAALAAQVHETRPTWVLSHTDLTGHNLIRTKNGVVHLIDWEGACLAPREFDLAFFSDEPYEKCYGPFLEEYARTSGISDFHEAAFLLRMYHRNFEDFVEGAKFVLQQDLDVAELDHALEVLLEDGVYDWPYFAAGEKKHREFMRLWRQR